MSFLYSQGQVEDSSEPTCSDGHQSGMSNLMTTDSASLQPGLETESCPTPQSSAISKHSSVQDVQAFIEALPMSSQPAFPASHSALAESATESETSATCGPKLSSASAWYDHNTSCWRTFQACFLRDTSEPFSETWSVAGMTVDGMFYRQRTLVEFTDEIGCGLLPTPVKRDGDGFYVVTKATSKKRIIHERGCHQIHWMQYSTLLHDLKKAWVNPRFSEWMMGWPIGWTDLQPLAMDKFRQWLEQHGNYCQFKE